MCFAKKVSVNYLSIFFFSAGEIVNLISVDSQKIEDAAVMLNMLWSCPLQVGLAIYFLYDTIGVSVFVGKLTELKLHPEIVRSVYSFRIVQNSTI